MWSLRNENKVLKMFGYVTKALGAPSSLSQFGVFLQPPNLKHKGSPHGAGGWLCQNQQENSPDGKHQRQQSRDLPCSVKVRCPGWKNHQGRDSRRGETPEELSKPGRQDARWFHQRSEVSARCSVCCACAERLPFPWSF